MSVESVHKTIQTALNSLELLERPAVGLREITRDPIIAQTNVRDLLKEDSASRQLVTVDYRPQLSDESQLVCM